MIIKNSTFPPKYTRYGKNIRKQNCSFQKDLQIRSWRIFHKSYFFLFIHQKRFYENQKIQFSRQNIRDTRKMLRNEIVHFKNIYKLALDNFFIKVISFYLCIKNVFMKINKFNFPAKICAIRKKYSKTKLFISKRSTN